jgi:phosphatidylglycerol lysyltransferase
VKERLLAAIGPAVGLALFALAAWILHHELAEYHYGDVMGHLGAIPRRDVALAIFLTAVSYWLLTGYDALAFRWIRSPLRYPRIALASFIAFVFSHNVGLSFFGGSAVRYRMFTSWGVGAADLARVITFNVITFWLGFLALGGAVLLLDPLPVPGALHPFFATSRPIGAVFLLALAVYALSTLRRNRGLRLYGFEVEQPGPGFTAAQLVLSSLDWLFAAAVFWVLLPEAGRPDLPTVLGAFLLAVVLGLVSHVPAGLGVFETAMVLLLAPWLPGDQVLGSALAYRLVYYLLPLLVGLGLFATYEVVQRPRALTWARDVFARWLPEFVPRFFAATVLAGGVVLLLSGATPAAPARTKALARLLPLPVMEVSHLLASVLGVALLLLARAIQQRVDAAYWATLVLLAAGAVASLAKGLDWEEALLLSAMAVALLPCHRWFYRRSSLLSQSFSPAWTTGIALILVATGFVVLLSYRHVDYAHELWWQFELDGHAPRSLRALAGGGLALAGFALLRLLRPAPPVARLPTPDELDRAAVLASAAPRASAFLALLGDKRLLFNERNEGFLMYGVHGRGWVAMGDPISASPDVRRELAWRFREEADRHGGLASFYEVGSEEIPTYLDLGLRLRKLGEEARVPLPEFTLSGRARAKLRHATNHLTRAGGRFEVIPAKQVPALLDELEVISEQWLAQKNTREKRFSLGCFDRDYLVRLPMALVRQQGRVIAFANVWAGEAREELSIDLMRHADDAPNGVMEYLFAELMGWGRDQGYRWFSLGMAPLAGLEHHRLAPPWTKLGALLFRHGEHFYNFRGLRAFKEKFDPVWEPRYLASPGGFATPFVLGHVAALVSGGVTGVVRR